MKDIIFDEFQNNVNESLIRHKSLIDIMTKIQESEARINRSIAKSITNCGCISVNAKKQHLPDEDASIDIQDLNKCLQSHIEGKLCDNCRDVIENEIGSNLFYISSLCNTLDLNLYDILLKENNKMNTLGKYNLR